MTSEQERYDRLDRIYRGFRGSRPRRRGLVCLTSGLLVLAVGAVFTFGSNGYVWIDRFDRPSAYAGIVPLLFATSAMCLIVRQWRVMALVVALSYLVAGIALLWALYDLTEGLGHDGPVEARGPAGARFHAVAAVRGGGGHPLWQVRVVQDRGLGSRQWQVTCAPGVTDLTWAGATRLVVRADDEELVFSIDPRTGRPVGAIPPDLWC